MIIYEALFCPCIYESTYRTISLHYTEEGAKKAIREHKIRELNYWKEWSGWHEIKKLHDEIKEGNIVYSTEYEELKEYLRNTKFGFDIDWKIVETEVKE